MSQWKEAIDQVFARRKWGWRGVEEGLGGWGSHGGQGEVGRCWPGRAPLHHPINSHKIQLLTLQGGDNTPAGDTTGSLEHKSRVFTLHDQLSNQTIAYSLQHNKRIKKNFLKKKKKKKLLLVGHSFLLPGFDFDCFSSPNVKKKKKKTHSLNSLCWLQNRKLLQQKQNKNSPDLFHSLFFWAACLLTAEAVRWQRCVLDSRVQINPLELAFSDWREET